jgi:hypothetical protein
MGVQRWYILFVRLFFSFFVESGFLDSVTVTVTLRDAKTGSKTGMSPVCENRPHMVYARVCRGMCKMIGRSLLEIFVKGGTVSRLWWMVQWGNEYLARFKRDGTKAKKTAHAAYKKWTADTKQKQMAGFTANLRSAAGADDSLNESLE